MPVLKCKEITGRITSTSQELHQFNLQKTRPVKDTREFHKSILIYNSDGLFNSIDNLN